MSIKIAKQYLDKGFPITPVPYGSKAPNIKDWNNLNITNDNVKQYFSDTPQNVAAVLGKEGSGLCDFDLDCLQAKVFADLFAPKTGYIYGHALNPASHMFYIVTGDDCNPVQFFHIDHGMIMEIRAKGQASMLPGSMHPDGELYEVLKDGNPTEVDCKTLLRAAALIATCSLMVLEWPAEGCRNNAALALAGMLCKAGYSDEEVISAVYHIAKEAEDEEADKRRLAAQETVKKYAKGISVVGIMAMKELFSEKTVNALSKWLGSSEQSEIDEMVMELNKTYALITLGGQAKILKFGKDLKTGHQSISFLNQDAFKSLLKNQKIFVGMGKKGPTYSSHADVWLEHKQRRTYEDMVFEPDLDVPDHIYNYWQGFAVQPDKKSSCDLFMEHLHQIICKGNDERFFWIVAWLANMVQEPGTKPGTAVVIRGKQGAGKSCIGEYLGNIFQPHYMCVNNPKHLQGQFNSHQFGILLMQADEAFWAGDKASEGVLKDMITSDSINIERKGIDVIKARNCMRLLITTNNDWAVPAAIDDRRFFVLDASDSMAQNHEYFSRLYEERQNGGPSALLDFLLNYDYPDINLRKAPQTEALFQQKIETMDAIGKALFEMLIRGYIHPEGKAWPEYIESEHFLEHCKKEAKKSSLPDKSQQTQFGIKLKKYLGKIKKAKKMITETDYETGLEYPVGHTVQRMVYFLPSLEECRKRFTDNTGIPFTSELLGEE